MRVASVAPAVAAPLVVLALASGCSGSSTSSFCGTLTHSKVDFGDVTNATRELAALDHVLAQLSQRDRKVVAPVRDYVSILYRRTTWTQKQQVTFLSRFFRVEAPALDKRLRDECNVSLDKRIAPFPVTRSST